MKCYSKVYLKWIKYLKDRKLYGVWIRDISTYTHMRDLFWSSYQLKVEKAFISKDIKYIISKFSEGEIHVRNLMVSMKLVIGETLETNWYQICSDFYEVGINQPIIKIKQKNSSNAKSVENQPWYSIIYEKNKHNKRTWKK